MDELLNAGKYKCVCGRNCNAYLNIARLNKGKLTFLNEEGSATLNDLEINMIEVPEMLKKISEVYNKEMQETGQQSRLEVITKDSQ